jgi:UDP-N-acetylmuramoyl-tripeptide--D-alanyl-D-alanine ligase
MIALSLAQLASVLSAQLMGDEQAATQMITSVSTDSRAIAAGDLFIALKGPNFDAHHFITEVAAKGASAVVVDHAVASPVPQLVVADTRLALGQLGAYVRQQIPLKTVAVTGSAGKTTVKEMMSAILSRLGNVLATAGNFNNDIGVPLTLLRLEPQHQYAVMELGANHLGEIAYTTSLVKPDVAVITNVAAAHLEGFGDLFGVARAKGEIYSGLPEHGLAIVPRDTEFFPYWQQRLQERPMQSFGLTPDADYYPTDIILNAQGCAGFTLHCPQGQIFIQLVLPGRHNVLNALAAAAVAIAAGASLMDVQLGLAAMQPVKGRINLIQANTRVRLIDDTYNANVDSAKAAIDLLVTYPGQRVLVLGDMAELGANARLYHEEVGLYAREQGVNLLFSLGVLSQSASDVMLAQGAHFSSRQSLVQKLTPILQQAADLTILVKGSRSAKMELVVQDLLERCQQEDPSC